ncbi:MAG: hypothetical protein GC160_17065 [Acidobacteria bacterium]|nr:hypothetical protein [Acidobacteriota bacterium]
MRRGAWLACWLASTLAAAEPQLQVPSTATGVAAVAATLGLFATAEEAAFRVVIGDSDAAQTLGFRPTPQTVRVAALRDALAPELEIFWQEPLEVPVFTLPEGAVVFTTEKRTGAPLAAGTKTPSGAVLWLAVAPGARGYERYPLWLHALLELGLEPPFRNARTWVFYDPAYRLRVEPNLLARRWREAGVAGVHVAGWPFFDGDEGSAERLRALLAACRRQGVLAYCWLELPHVSEGFWQHFPQCREKTAAGLDAQLDWRKLIALSDPACAQQARQGVERLLTGFAWDGVNLAELYFESLYGPADPTRLTPFHPSAREAAQAALGFDPLALFDADGDRFWSRSPESWKAFADWRADLALRLQAEWLGFLRQTLPRADLVVTQIDDRFEPRMRELLGADAGALLALPEEDFTLLIEDPAPLWALGPERYERIAAAYAPLTGDPGRLAIDLNIVERYQQTYPTRKQLGGEFLTLVDQAGRGFERVALYFESSISGPDLALLPRIAAGARIVERAPNGARIVAESPRPFGLSWDGSAIVDGGLWPLSDRHTVWLPRGRHVVEAPQAPQALPPARVLWLNAEPLAASVHGREVRFSYCSQPAAPVLLDRRPAETLVDGRPYDAGWEQTRSHWSGRLPPGEHTVRLVF